MTHWYKQNISLCHSQLHDNFIKSIMLPPSQKQEQPLFY
jgi:hypothetical protein